MGVIKGQLQQAENSIDVSDALDEDLYYAVADDNYNEVVRLLDQGANPANSSSIIAAARNIKAALISLLIQYGADPDYFFRGETPLSILIQDDEVELVSQLLDQGANPEMGTPLSSPLQIAVELGSINMVQLLLKHGADSNSFMKEKRVCFRFLRN
nr:ankyrin repeat domain-containing protein [Paenibacillus barcinonensis]